MSKTIDLNSFRDDGRRLFSGYTRGANVRQELGLDQLDGEPDVVVVMVPDDVLAVTSSFFQGLFEDSIKALGATEFRNHYQFVGAPIDDTVETVLRYARALAPASLAK